MKVQFSFKEAKKISFSQKQIIVQDKIESLKSYISTYKKSLIVTHPNPDGDAFGSILGWGKFLEKSGHQITLVSPTNFTQNFNWLDGYHHILSFENATQKAIIENEIKNAEIIFCLDFNALNRLESLGDLIAASSAKKVMIDHHQMPAEFANITFCDQNYAATCEYIFDIICILGEQQKLDKTIAENLYTGLTTDTGFFAYSNTTKNVHKVAGELINLGVSPEYIQDKVFNIYKEKRLRYIGYCLLNKLKIVNEGKVAYIMVSKEEARQFNLQPGDNEGLVNFPFKIEGVKVSVLFTEESEKVKISFRSKENIDVNAFARKHFEGGGHINAAGGKSMFSIAETEHKFLNLISDLF
jgi:phosphoesterase RecJ-like protein